MQETEVRLCDAGFCLNVVSYTQPTYTRPTELRGNPVIFLIRAIQKLS